LIPRIPSFVERGGLWVLGQGLLMLTVVWTGFTWAHQWNGPLSKWSGGLLLFVGAALGLLGGVALNRNLTPFPQPSSSARLVQTGVYAWMRHPLYTAVASTALGWALWQQSLPSVLASAVLGVFFDAKARREERWLRQRFPEYSQYARRVSRFLPGIY
jgi:protein-S-isoprenylcysteine O-methyltransferase Ste14